MKFGILLISLTLCLSGLAKDKKQTLESATFAGGCFWCMQPPFDELKGVHSTLVGYTGGPEKDPTYKQVSYGKTGHAEAVQIVFDPKVITYQKLLKTFWHNINPTQVNGQFADKGRQYRTEIFYHNESQRKQAELSRKEISSKFKKPIATKITKASTFFKAEDYHQKYYKKNPAHYNAYKVGSGRAGYIKKTWGK